MRPRPMIAVTDVEESSGWYQRVLGFESAHGGPDYDQLVVDGAVVMQLHRWEVDEHPHLGNPEAKPNGNGVVLWFHTDDVVRAFQRALDGSAEIVEPLRVNPNANHREFWMKDLDGYVVVVAGEYGDLG